MSQPQVPPTGAPAIELRGITHRYAETPVLRGIDLAIAPGEIFGFLGHNGAGKTTTVNVLTTLILPDSGSACVAGHDVVTENLAVRQRIGYVPENVRLYNELTVAENLKFFAELSGVRKIPARIDMP